MDDIKEPLAETAGLLAKKADDLTVGDALKIQGVATIIGIAIPLVIVGGIGAAGAFADWRRARKLAKDAAMLDYEATKKSRK